MTRDDLALYAIGHYDGDAAAVERRLDQEPELAQQLVAETDFASLMRAAVSEATFCPRCHDLMDGERCAACAAAPAVIPIAKAQRRSTWPVVLASVTLAAAIALVLVMRREDDAPRSQAATGPIPSTLDAALEPTQPRDQPPELPGPAETVERPAAPLLPMKEERPPTKPISKVVALKISTKPRGVAAWIDGQYLGLTPVLARVPRSSTPSRLSLQHIGHKPHTRDVDVSSDRSIQIVMEPTGAPVPHEGKFTDEQCMQCHQPSPRF